MARPPHERDEALAKKIEQMAAFGTPNDLMVQLVGLSWNTIKKYYKAEVTFGKEKAHLAVKTALFQKCQRGHAASIFFYLKTQCGWRETQGLEITQPEGEEFSTRSTVRNTELAKLSDEELILFMDLRAKMDGDEGS